MSVDDRSMNPVGPSTSQAQYSVTTTEKLAFVGTEN